MGIKTFEKPFDAEVMNNKGIWHTVRLVAEETFDNGQKAFIDICGYYYNFHMPTKETPIEETMVYLINVSGLWQKTTKEMHDSTTLPKAETEAELFEPELVLGKALSMEDLIEMDYIID